MTIRGSAISSMAAFALALGVGAAQGTETATVTEMTRSVAVHYPEGALNGQESREALRARLEIAARRACGPVDRKVFHERRRWQACYDAALATALEQIDSPQLAAATD